MDAYILDTSVLSALLFPTHRRHGVAVDAVDGMDPDSTKWVSPVSLAEFRFGVRLAELTGDSRAPALRNVLNDAGKYAVLEITGHTAEAYSELRSRMAVKYLRNPTREGRPRWVEDWADRARGKKLGIDENDLWQCAQARERDFVFVTADKRIQRIADADPALRLRIV